MKSQVHMTKYTRYICNFVCRLYLVHLLLSPYQLFFFLFRQTGAFSRILWKIVRHDFLQFIVVFLVILLAFSGAFVLSLKGEDILDANDEIRYLQKTTVCLEIIFMKRRYFFRYLILHEPELQIYNSRSMNS